MPSLNRPQPTPPRGDIEAGVAAGGRGNAGLGDRRGKGEPRGAGARRLPDSPCRKVVAEAEGGRALSTGRCLFVV